MLRSRIIPCLLVHQNGLVKTTQFKDPKYVGDPLNAVKIFNEKEVDELMVIDIDASVDGKEPDFELIKKLAYECRMPLCYGGGVKTVAQAMKIISLGAEKVALSSAVIENIGLVKEIGKAVGLQSVVVVLDVLKKKSLFGTVSYELYTHNGKKATGINPIELVKQLETIGIGELVLNSIDRDGMLCGYDEDLAQKVRSITSFPLTILGGAGSMADMESLTAKIGISGLAAGSMFVFKGKYKAVLISYPTESEKKSIYNLTS